MHGARILVVDDEQQIRRSLQVNLEGKGYTVVTAEHGDSALQALAIRSPDVIILDLIMPGMTRSRMMTSGERTDKACNAESPCSAVTTA